MKPVSGEDGNPFADEAAREEGRLLFAGPCTFLLSVTTMEDLPGRDLPEIAFAGRSNVGKSSLLNALIGHRDMARVSQEPGRTRELNFFQLGQTLTLADLPGYGYARAPKKEIAKWTKLTREYLSGRSNLRRVLLLIDARHGIKGTDEEVMALLDEAAVSFQAVFTKADKIKKGSLETLVKTSLDILRKHPAAHPELVITSSRTGEGMEELRARLGFLAKA